MKTVEVYARSVEEAIADALSQLERTIDEVDIEILEVSSKGFLGILGGKQAKVKATVKQADRDADTNAEADTAADNDKNRERDTFLRQVQSIIQTIIGAMGIKADIIAEKKDEYLKITMCGENMGILIGRRGETLDALQYLVNLIANKHSVTREKIIIDAEGYRQRREETLINLAARLAERAKRTGQRVVLEPMNPQERRIIHTALQEDAQVQTLSEGQEPYRKVVISLKTHGAAEEKLRGR